MQAKRQTDMENKKREDAERDARVAAMKKEADAKAAKQAAEIKQKIADEKKAAAAPKAAEEDWSKELQAQLVAGMKEFGADLPTKERW